MAEQLGREPDLDKCPPDFTDLPWVVQEALQTYNKLGDRVADYYIGKDYSLLIALKSLGLLPETNIDLFMEALLIIDEYNITQARKAMEKEIAKTKRGKK